MSDTMPKLYTTSQAAEAIGGSSDTIRRLAESGEFPNCYRLGKHLRIPVLDVDAYIERQRVGSTTATGGES